MRKIRKLIYNYVFRRVVAWHNGHIEDQELTNALYSYDIYYEPNKGVQMKDIKTPFTFKSIAEQIKESIPVGNYIVLVTPPQNLNSDQMTEKILNSLPTGTGVFKIMG